MEASPRIYAIHHSAPIFQSSVRASRFGRERWGQVNSFEQIDAGAPMGAGLPFEESTVYRAFRAVFRRGESWESTEWFRRNLKLIEAGQMVWNCSTREQWLDRLNNDVRALYESIRRHGFLEQEQIAEKARSEPGAFEEFVREDYPSTVGAHHEIKLGINEEGQLLFLDGRHRLTIAKLLGVDRIPVRVVFVHRAFLERQPGWAQAAGGLEDSRWLASVIEEHLLAAGRGAAAERVRYLTCEEFFAAIQPGAPDRAKANAARWEFHRSAIDFVRLCRPRAASDVLQLGTAGVPVVHGCHTLGLAGRVGQGGTLPTWARDARELPWPVADKHYQVLVALRVLHHLAPQQEQCFREARRVARHLVMVVPETEDLPEGDPSLTGISEAQLVAWNNGAAPTVSVRLPGRAGRLYFWNAEALRV